MEYIFSSEQITIFLLKKQGVAGKSLETKKKIRYLGTYHDDNVYTRRPLVPLIEPESRYSLRVMLFVGIPSFVAAVIISLAVHSATHIATEKYSCTPGTTAAHTVVDIFDYTENESGCPSAALAGIVSTCLLAFGSFALFLHHPRNIFLASMAFVNASRRVPESFIVFFQLLFKREATHISDESLSMQLLHFKDPTAFVVILCFYTLTMLFLSMTIVHDVRIVKHKWIVAAALLIILVPLENFFWKVLSPLFPAG